MGFYASFGTVLLLLAITAPTALAFGFFGASAPIGINLSGKVTTSSFAMQLKCPLDQRLNGCTKAMVSSLLY
jgi:hypothetical protein